MSAADYSPSRPRKALLSIVMAALLAASVAVAYWLQRPDVLAEIRRRGLGDFYGPLPSEQWFLCYQSGQQPIGWRVRILRPGEDGFVGTVIQEGPAAGSFLRQSWRISDDARTGRYESQDQSPQGPRADTSIHLADGQVTVEQTRPPFRATSRATAPVSYLPEGTTLAAMQVVAERRTAARFRIILDDRNHMRRVDFTDLALEYLGTGQTPDGATVRRVQATFHDPPAGAEQVYEMDESGRIVAIRSRGIRWQAVDQAAVEAAFPSRAEVIRRMLGGDEE